MVEFLGPITGQGKAKPTQIIFSTQFKISPTVVVIVAVALNIMSGSSNLCEFFVQILLFLLNFGKLQLQLLTLLQCFLFSLFCIIHLKYFPKKEGIPKIRQYS